MRRPTTRRCDSESMFRNLQRFRQLASFFSRVYFASVDTTRGQGIIRVVVVVVVVINFWRSLLSSLTESPLKLFFASVSTTRGQGIVRVVVLVVVDYILVFYSGWLVACRTGIQLTRSRSGWSFCPWGRIPGWTRRAFTGTRSSSSGPSSGTMNSNIFSF